VDHLDDEFKSLYPICLFFKQLGFRLLNINSPQYPQSPTTRINRRSPCGSRPRKTAIHRAIHNTHTGVKSLEKCDRLVKTP